MNKSIETFNRNFKLFFEYLYFNLDHFYLIHKNHGSKNITMMIPQNLLYFSSLHMRFSSIFYSSQLVDIFAYELPLSNTKSNLLNNPLSFNTIVAYNFHNLTFQERFFLFCVESSSQYSNFSLSSITELYPNAA